MQLDVKISSKCISSAQKGAAVICRYNFLFTQQNLPPTSLTLVLFEICTFCTLWICFSSIRENWNQFWFETGQQLLSKTFYGKIIQGPCTKFNVHDIHFEMMAISVNSFGLFVVVLFTGCSLFNTLMPYSKHLLWIFL